MRLATLDEDHWELDSGEARHQSHPESFWIPPLEERQNLQPGQVVKLLFDIEVEDEAGESSIGTERMWVVVAQRWGELYIGRLANQPALFAPTDEVYLCFGAEIPFLAEHVIDITEMPAEQVAWYLSQEPARRWPRD